MNAINKKIIEELLPVLNSIGKIEFEYEFCDNIGLLKQNLTRIKQGKAHFTASHIENICKVYGINANWIFGIENQMFAKINKVQKGAQTAQIE